MAYLGLLLAGILLCNALPHLMSGLQGRRFFTPWARDGGGSALENVLWGCGNLLVAVLLIDRIFLQNVPHGLMVLAAGFVTTAVALAVTFGGRTKPD